MLGFFFVFTVFFVICGCALMRPWVGIVGFYGFVLLEPEWNWRWSLPPDFGFQKWIFACLLIGWVINGFPGQPLRGWPGIACAAFVGFLSLAFISSQQSIDPVLSEFFMENMWKIVVTAILAVRLLDQPHKIWAMLWTVSIAHGYNAYGITREYLDLGYCQYVFQTEWAFEGSNQVANLAVCASAASLALLFFAPKTWQKMLAGAIFLLQAHQVMLLESRGCMLGMIALVMTAVILMPKTRTNIRAVVVAAVGISLLAGPSVVAEFQSIFVAEEELDTSADSRKKLWKAGAAITADYPLLGVGPLASERLVPQYYEGGLDTNKKALHNLVFEISTGSGIPATLMYFTFLMAPGIRGFFLLRKRSLRDNAPHHVQAGLFAASSGLAGFLVANQFSAGALMEGSYTLAATGLAAVLVLQREYLGCSDLPQQGLNADETFGTTIHPAATQA